MIIDIPLWLLALLAIVTFLYVYGTWTHNFFVKHRIPFLKPFPFVGNMGPVAFRRRNIADLIMDIYNAFPQDKMVGFFNMNVPNILIKDPEIIKLVTVKDFDHFTDHNIPISEEAEPLFGKNLFALKGDRWRDMRHTLSPAFTSSKMKAMFLLVEKCGQQMGEYLEKKCKAEKDGLLNLEMKEFYTKYTNDVIATAAFGISCDSLEQPDNEFYQMGKVATNISGLRMIVFFLYSICPKIMQALGMKIFPKVIYTFFTGLVHDTIATREKEGIIRPDMIHLLMQARKGTLTSDVADAVTTDTLKNKKRELTKEDITAQAFIFFFAGFDTSSTLLGFMTYLLATHPDIQTRLQEDIDALLEEENGKVTYEGIQRMKYLDMIISEALRLWPPAIISDRVCVRSYVLPATSTSPSIKLNVGDVVMMPTIALHRDPQFFPDPERFDPERFSDENKHKINPSVYIPFGVGPRVCIGNRFALMEAKIAMVHLLSRFTLQVVEKTTIPLRLDKKTGFSMKIEGGTWIGIKLRSS